MTAPPEWVARKVFEVDSEARLAWISTEGVAKSLTITYSRIRDNKEEYTEKREVGDSTGYFALVKLVDRKRMGNDTWVGNGIVFSRTGSSKKDWPERFVPFRVANLLPEDVFSGRVAWYLHRWNIPVKIRMMEDLARQEKAYAERSADMAGSMADELMYEAKSSNSRSMILPTRDDAEYKAEVARAHGDSDRSDTNPYTRQKQLVKETFKDEYAKPRVA